MEALSEDGLQKTKAGEDRRQIGSRRFAPGDDEKPDARFFLPPSARSAQTDPSPVFPNLCLLIHGWGMDRRIWSPCLAALGNVAETRFVDLPGYGEAPDHGLDFAGTARFLADSLPAGAILCGWSLGALLAMQAALLSPRRVGGLILVGGTPCFIRRNGWTTAQSPAMLKKFSADVSDDSRTALRRFAALFNQGDATARLTARAAVQGILSAPPASATLLAGLDWLRDADLRERVPEIGCPTLLIHGECDPLMPLAAARWLAEKLPRARLDVFAGAAHAPFLNDPERFARLVGGFLHDIRTDQAARS
ncbi:MAG: alpha/beta fold hydrolase [Candidatus Accumulibacter sp.]|nr:alpha/beta fold hydrolase [Accumulibacter sp.]